MSNRFRTILIANRGEIACRVIRTAKRLGYKTVAVFSDADRGAPHVVAADVGVHVGGSAAADSYLSVSAILAAAKATGADAIHPGYGFLAENASFARACEGAGLIFIGPTADVIDKMGDKAAAKRMMAEASVPTVPGYEGTEQEPAALLQAAKRVGFPLLIKAVAGGGGRGMRRVDSAAEFSDQLAGAKRESQSAFGSSAVILERYIVSARHVEIQVFGDTQGHVVHLFERDCTAQRRRQKVIEESPCRSLDEVARAEMAAAAVRAAAAVGYVGAGTVEFIVNDEDEFFFLEMNTRLQVEHPVTEYVTGLDLVEWQLLVAAGEPLPLNQDAITTSGHAIEARLYAEAPELGFAPQVGAIADFSWAAVHRPDEGMRVDAGVKGGSEVSPYYDAMVAKFVAHGCDREQARQRLMRMLLGAPLFGVRTNQAFLLRLLAEPTFVDATLRTHALDQAAEESRTPVVAPDPPDLAWVLAALLFLRGSNGDAGFRSRGRLEQQAVIAIGSERRCIQIVSTIDGGLLATLPNADQLELRRFKIEPGQGDRQAALFEADGVAQRVALWRDESRLQIWLNGNRYDALRPSGAAGGPAALDPREVRAPVAGNLVRIAALGDAVEPGDVVAVIEAMKMETPVEASIAGTVSAVEASSLAQVAAGDLLVRLAANEVEEKQENNDG